MKNIIFNKTKSFVGRKTSDHACQIFCSKRNCETISIIDFSSWRYPRSRFKLYTIGYYRSMFGIWSILTNINMKTTYDLNKWSFHLLWYFFRITSFYQVLLIATCANFVTVNVNLMTSMRWLHGIFTKIKTQTGLFVHCSCSILIHNTSSYYSHFFFISLLSYSAC